LDDVRTEQAGSPARCTCKPTRPRTPEGACTSAHLLQTELAFERAVFRHRQLSLFRRNATTWEALLMIATGHTDEGPGLYEIVETAETTALGQSALLRFLRDRRDDGSVIFRRSRHKQSKWTLEVSATLRADLLGLLHFRMPLRAGEDRMD
jgi:hypothetical protein